MGKEVKATVGCLDIEGLHALDKIERAARICYNSEAKAKLGGAEAFLRGQILATGHESVIEHEGTVFVCSNIFDSELMGFLGAWPNFPMIQTSFHKREGGGWDAIISGNFRAFRDLYKIAPEFDLAEDIMARLIDQVPLMGYGLDENIGKRCSEDKMAFLGLQSQWGLNAIDQIDGVLSIADESRMKHGTLTFRIDGVSRALTHQLVRHRPCAFSQRSQRYCGEKDFDFIMPPETQAKDVEDFSVSGHFGDVMAHAAADYGLLQEHGLKNEDARFVLPNACETNIVVTATLNQWLHMCRLRTSSHAQWEIRGVIKQIAEQIASITKLPAFMDLKFE